MDSETRCSLPKVRLIYHDFRVNTRDVIVQKLVKMGFNRVCGTTCQSLRKQNQKQTSKLYALETHFASGGCGEVRET
jgi:hypothetical protein